MLLDNFSTTAGAASSNRFGGKISTGRSARWSAVIERYRSAKRAEKGADPRRAVREDGLASHAVPLRLRVTVCRATSRYLESASVDMARQSDDGAREAPARVCGKRLKMMIPTLLPALEQHGRLKLGLADRDRALAIAPQPSTAMVIDLKSAASGGSRGRTGFHLVIRASSRRAAGDLDGRKQRLSRAGVRRLHRELHAYARTPPTA
jgi:hypothetical protein